MSSLRLCRPPRFLRPAVALLACVVTAMFGVSGAASPAGGAVRQTAPARNVVVVGDSITDIASGPIEEIVGSTYPTYLTDHDGMRIDQMLPALGLEVAAHAPVYAVVENLGTNDALQGGRHADWRASWAKMLSITAKVPCVVLTTINLTTDSFGGRPVAVAINREIADLARSDPARYKVVDWHGFLTEAWTKHRATFFDYLRKDLVHEYPPGARWLAEEDRAALADCGSHAQPAIIPPSKQLLGT